MQAFSLVRDHGCGFQCWLERIWTTSNATPVLHFTAQETSTVRQSERDQHAGGWRVMNRALLELHGAAQLRRGLLPLSSHLSDLQSVNGSYAQSCCDPKLAQVLQFARIANNPIIAQLPSCLTRLRCSRMCSHTCMKAVERCSCVEYHTQVALGNFTLAHRYCRASCCSAVLSIEG